MHKLHDMFRGTAVLYFWWLVFSGAFKEIPSFQPVRDRLMEIILWLMLAVLAFMGLIDLGDIAPDWTTLGIFLLALIMGRFVQNLILIPARMYFAEKDTANLYTWEGIRIEEYHFPNDGVFGYGLEMTSTKKHRAHHLSSEVVYAGYSGKKILEGDLPLPVARASIEKQMKFFGEKNIDNKTPRYFAVVNANKDRVWLETAENREECLGLGAEPGAYTIDVMFRARFDGIPLRPDKRVRCVLDYDGEKITRFEIQ